MAVENMILRLMGVGFLIAMWSITDANGVMAREYEFAPPEALDLAEELDPHQPLHTPDQSRWTLSDISQTADVVPASRSCAECGGGACSPPTWYWEQNVRVLSRSKVRPLPLALRQIDIPANPYNPANSPPEPVVSRLTVPVMTNKSLTFDIAAGYDTTVGHYLGRDAKNRDQFVEFTYWGMNTWNENRQVNGPRAIYTDSLSYLFSAGELVSLFPDDVGGFNRADSHYASCSSDINNFELNVRIRPRGRPDRLVLKPSGKWQRECQPGKTLSYLIGFRYLSLDDMFGWHSRGTIVDSLLGTNPVSGDYDILTHNYMFGPQVGAELMFNRCRYSFGARTKLAPMVNFSDQTSTIVTSSAGDPLATYGNINDLRYAKKDDCSVIGELSILGNYRIRKDLVVHAGYHFTWITGLALAGEQIQFQPNAPDRINDNGHTLHHGLSGGLEWLW